jgi:hypothetical protein
MDSLQCSEQLAAVVSNAHKDCDNMAVSAQFSGSVHTTDQVRHLSLNASMMVGGRSDCSLKAIRVARYGIERTALHRELFNFALLHMC